MSANRTCIKTQCGFAGVSILFALVMSLVLSGCGVHASESIADEASELYYDEASEPVSTAVSMGSNNAMQRAANSSGASERTTYADEVANAGNEYTAAETAVDADSIEIEAANQDSSRRLIRNVNISMETTQLDELTSDVINKVKALGGYIEYSWLGENGYNTDDTRYVNYTLRIPADKLDDFLNTALSAGKITSQSENVEDITLKYSDLESRVRTLETEQDRLLELIGSAQDVDAIIALETRLSEIRYELDSINSSLKLYDNQVTYSTVTLYISEVKVASAAKDATFGEKIAAGLSDNLLKLKDNLENAAITLIISIPAIIVFIVLALIALIIIKLFFKAAIKILGIKLPGKLKKCEKEKKQKKQGDEAKPESKSET